MSKRVKEHCCSSRSIAEWVPAPVIEGMPKKNNVDHRLPPSEWKYKQNDMCIAWQGGSQGGWHRTRPGIS